MKTKLLSLALLLPALALPAHGAQAATANAAVVAPQTTKITAPFAGTLLPFDLKPGDRVAEGDALMTLDAVPVYAPISGKVAAVFAAPGDDAEGVCAHYGALAVIEPTHALYIDASTDQAYDDDENRYLHAGETLYLKCGNEKGTGLVTSVAGKRYTVEIRTGAYDPGDTVRCYRESGMPSDSEVGRGKVVRYPDTSVVAAGRVSAVQAKAGQSVQVGDPLFELVDAQSARDASRTISAPVSGAVTQLSTASGAQVYRGQLLCEIADLGALELRAEVDEIDLSALRVGDTLGYTVDAFGEQVFSGKVTAIYPLGSAQQNATYFDVRITLPESETFLPGMNATVTLGE